MTPVGGVRGHCAALKVTTLSEITVYIRPRAIWLAKDCLYRLMMAGKDVADASRR